MTIRDSVDINAPVDVVWPWVQDPENMTRWNPKVQKVTAMSPPYRLGYKYGIMYAMNNKVTEYSAEFVEYEHPFRLTIRLTTTLMDQSFFVEEKYLLESHNNTTHLSQEVVVHDSTVNVFWNILVWLIMRIGKPVGERYLEKLKSLVEHG